MIWGQFFSPFQTYCKCICFTSRLFIM